MEAKARGMAIVAAAIVAACTRQNDASKATPDATATAPEGPAKKAAPATRVVMDFVETSEDCAFGHRGTLLDLGDVTTRSHIARVGTGAPDVDTRERDGASWLRVRERSLLLSFTSPEPSVSDSGVVIETRARGALAKSISLYLDGKAVGKVPLTKAETKTVSIALPSETLSRGAHELRLGFNGGPRAGREDLAELDWIRVGPSDGPEPYAAPTRSDVVTTTAVSGISKRSVSLRAPGFARCTGFVPNGASLEASLGVTGGQADAEVRLVIDRKEPRVIGTFHLGGEEKPSWKSVSLPLGEIDTLATIELVAKSSSKGARVLFADPKVVVETEGLVAKAPPSRGLIVVVLGTTAPKSLSTYGGAVATPELDALATRGVVFERHRASTSYANGSVASLLTGLPSAEHGIRSPQAVLGEHALTITEAARQGGVVTAMFTANPTTSEAFGFARGWETFTAHAPGDHLPATAVFDDAARWLDAHKADRFLVVVHARGGHPPWDVTNDELSELPPSDYAGALEPQHAGEALAKAKRAGGARSFSDADRERAFALHQKAVRAHDAALGRLVAHVAELGRAGDTTFIVTGDVGVDPSDHVPFLEDEGLDEAALALPLVAQGPSVLTPGRTSLPTSSIDLAPTILAALGLPPPPVMRGLALFDVPTGARTPIRPLFATTEKRYSARWADFVVSGAKFREGKFCSLSLEPDCVSDVGPAHPLATEAFRTLIFQELGAGPASASAQAKGGAPVHTEHAEAPPPDATTARALHAWGR